jgi:2-iminoacetate synthase ThiH
MITVVFSPSLSPEAAEFASADARREQEKEFRARTDRHSYVFKFSLPFTMMVFAWCEYCGFDRFTTLIALLMFMTLVLCLIKLFVR